MNVTETPIVETFDPPRSGQQRRFTTEQKLSLLEEAKAPGSSISAVARRYGIWSSLVFEWKHMQDEGALAAREADERVVAETEVTDLRAKVSGSLSASSARRRWKPKSSKMESSLPGKRG
jgi:transposase-like protein